MAETDAQLRERRIAATKELKLAPSEVVAAHSPMMNDTLLLGAAPAGVMGIDNKTVGAVLIDLVHLQILPARGIRNDKRSVEVTRLIVGAWEKRGGLETLYERINDPTRHSWLETQVDRALKELPAWRSRSRELEAETKIPSPVTRQQS